MASPFLQPRPHELFHGRLFAQHRLRGADGFVRLGLLEAQRHQGERCVVEPLIAGGQRAGGAARLPP